jgi:protease I
MKDLKNFRVAVLATDGFEESELTEPVKALKEAGARVDVVAPKEGKIQGFKHFDKSIQVPVDRLLSSVWPDEYDAVVLPGGAINADHLRVLERAKFFVRKMQEAGKPIAVICHGGWLLVSADLVEGRKVTSYYTIQDDFRNAGALWMDDEVVVDQNWVSSRNPDDLPAFNREMLRVFSEAQEQIREQAAA